jgi:hypothetical protein
VFGNGKKVGAPGVGLPNAEHLPRTQKIELLDLGKDEQGDLLRTTNR